MTIDSKNKYRPGGPISKDANEAGIQARRDERIHGHPASALAPDPWCNHQVTRDAWVTGYMSEVKARG